MDFEIIFKFITGGLNHDPTTPPLNKVLSSNVALIVVLSIMIIAVLVGLYGLGIKIFGKKKAWKAIIPVYGMMELFKAISLNQWLAIPCYVPLIGIIPFGIFCFFLPKAFDQKIDFQILTIFFPYVMFNMIGFDPKYDFQYIKGKNVAFKNEFRTVMPEDLSSDAMTPAAAVSGAAVSSMLAKESMISRAASAAAEQTRLIREEQEKAAAEEERKKKEEEEKKKAAKQRPEDFNYDIFNSDENKGPDTASLNIDFKMVNGKFKSAGLKGVAPKPVTLVEEKPPVEPRTPAAPAPIAPAGPAPVTPAAPTPVETPAPAAPVAPAPVEAPAAPAEPAPASPGISISPVPPKA
ncbi:hypothetical protein J6W91_03530 [Candidatus Saccharibacteria bacterium]|nr:hypothetical protein [Candidatus Saccharibacteria bacterium]